MPQNSLRQRMLSALAVSYLMLGTAAGSLGGEFYEKEGAAIKGHDPVAYFTEQKAVKGSPIYKSEYKGSIFYFASASNRDVFLADPQKFAPQYGGYCAFGTAKGYKAAIDPAAFTIVAGKLYLNYSETVRSQWQKDIPGHISKADNNWPEVQKLTKVTE